MKRIHAELKGKTINLWFVVEKHGPQSWLCVCVCGNQKILEQSVLLSRTSKSCGCRRSKLIADALTTHGEAGHGARKTPEYRSWGAMRSRCNNPKDDHYAYYGGRGITVCERWSSFKYFLEDMGRRPTLQHTLERKDTNGNYEPSNCTWATRDVQSQNRRNNRYITFNGETKLLEHWARPDLTKQSIWIRLKKGWSVERALTVPCRILAVSKGENV